MIPMKITGVELVNLGRGGNVLVMPMVLADGERVVHCDVEASDDDERVSTIALTPDEAIQFAALLTEAAEALRRSGSVRGAGIEPA